VNFRFIRISIILALSGLLLVSCSSSKNNNTNPQETSVSTVQPSSTPEPTATIEPYILEGATTTESGLQFLDLVVGTGATPQKGDLISFHYIGSLPDGTQFANSNEGTQSVYVVYGQDQILPGLEEGLGLMKAGGKARMVLPPELAFGTQGYNTIPPNSQIILDIDLFSAEKPPQPTSFSEEDLTTTTSGLKYVDLILGDGAEVKANDVVSNRFAIWVQTDTGYQYIGSSLGSDPLTFAQGSSNTVFEGWDEGVLGMKVGGKRLLVVPPELGLGEAGGETIPANSTLVMEVEITDVKPAPVMTDVPEEDYITTASGLKYYDIVVGDGATPETGQTVVVHYTGWLEDGTLFDSSVVRGTPFSFTLGNGSVIPGWDEGVATMKVGGKRQLKVPPELAYGESGSGEVIPPAATLIFEIELLEIQP
jgi:peptidylprolyl isomerase